MLRKWKVEDGGRRRSQAIVLHVNRYADDLDRLRPSRRIRSEVVQLAADRVVISEESMRHRFVDDRHCRRGRLEVARIEVAALHDRSSKRAEVVDRNRNSPTERKAVIPR